MKNTLLIIAVIITAANFLHAQPAICALPDTVFSVSDLHHQPSFPGGEAEMMRYMLAGNPADVLASL